MYDPSNPYEQLVIDEIAPEKPENTTIEPEPAPAPWYQPDAYRSSYILSQAHNAKTDLDLPDPGSLEWAMQYQIDNESNNYWVKSFKRVLPGAVGAAAADFTYSGALEFGAKTSAAMAGGVAGSMIGGAAASVLTPTFANIGGRLGAAVGAPMGPVGLAVGAGVGASLGWAAAQAIRLATTLSAASMAYTAADVALYTPTPGKEALGMEAPTYADVPKAGVDILKDLPLIAAGGLAVKGAMSWNLNRVRNGAPKQTAVVNAEKMLDNQALAKQSNFGAAVPDIGMPPAKWGMVDLQSQISPEGIAEKSFNVERMPNSNSSRYDQKLKIKNEEELNQAIIDGHLDNIDKLPDGAEKSRYLNSQMRDAAINEEMYKSELLGELFKDWNIPDHKIPDFHELFAYNEELDNLIGDSIRARQSLYDDIKLPDSLSTDLIDKINNLQTGMDPMDFVRKITQNVVDAESRLAKLSRSLGVETNQMPGYLAQNHDAHQINMAGKNVWKNDILNYLNEKKTFEDRHNKAVEERMAEIQKRDEKRKVNREKRKIRSKKHAEEIQRLKDYYTEKDFAKYTKSIEAMKKRAQKLSDRTYKAIDRAAKAREEAEYIPLMQEYAVEAVQMATDEYKVTSDLVKSLTNDINKEYYAKRGEIDQAVQQELKSERQKMSASIEAINKSLKETKSKTRKEELRRQREQIKSDMREAYLKRRADALGEAYKTNLSALREAKNLELRAFKSLREAERGMEKTIKTINSKAKYAIDRVKQLERSTDEAAIQEAKALEIQLNEIQSAADSLSKKQQSYVQKSQKREIAQMQSLRESISDAYALAKKIAYRESKGIFMRPWSDLTEAEKATFKSDFLDGAYDNIAIRDGQMHNGVLGGGARSWDTERVLHFKNQDSWRNYNRNYGHRINGTVLSTSIEHMRKAAKTLGIREKFGPNPTKTINDLRNIIKTDKSIESLSARTHLWMGENWQKAMLSGGGGNADPRRSKVARGVFNIMDDALSTWRTKNSYVYALIQEASQMMAAQYQLVGIDKLNSFFGSLKNAWLDTINSPNKELMREIGVLNEYLNGFDDLVDNDVYANRDSKAIQGALKLRNGARAVHMGSRHSRHNYNITMTMTQYHMGTPLAEGVTWDKLSKPQKRLIRLSGITKKDYNLTLKHKDIMMTPAASHEAFSRFGDSYLMNWTNALRNIDQAVIDGKILEGRADRLSAVARKWGKAQYKVSERVVASGDKTSKAFFGLATDRKGFFERVFPFVGWSFKEVTNFIENGDYRLPEGTSTLKAFTHEFLQRLVYGMIISFFKYLEQGRMIDLTDDFGEVDSEKMSNFLIEAVYHGGVTQGLGSMTDDLFKGIINGYIYKSPESAASTLGRMVGGEVGAYALQDAVNLGKMIYYAMADEEDKMRKYAGKLIPNLPNLYGGNILAHRLFLDPLLEEMVPDYSYQVSQDADRKSKTIAPYIWS